MTKWPKISVVVPSCNQGRFLGQALASIIEQRYPHLQLIVMDGGSTDESIAIIKAHAAHIDYWQSKPDGGQAAAVNAAVERADGDIVCWVNSDDFLEEHALWIVGRAATAHPGCGMYIGNGFRFDERTQSRRPFTLRSLGFSREALKHGLDYIQQPSVFFSRAAWNAVGGLDPRLKFGLDWDLLIRIADRYPVTLINEFLSCSREYRSTKTASGGLERAVELCEIAHRHAGSRLTVGTLVYLLEALHGSPMEQRAEPLRAAIAAAEHQAFAALLSVAGASDGFPARVDPDVSVFLPLVGSGPLSVPKNDVQGLPTISIVTPSFNQAEFLSRTLASVAEQNYPGIEHIVIDGGSADASVSILRAWSEKLSHWESEKDNGPANAVNKGFRRAKGEILAWLNSDDMLAEGALDLVGRTFRDYPEVDLVFANAIYIDGCDKPVVMDHGEYRTSLYYGRMQPINRIPAYWSYVHGIPQPTVFFRRRILERAGPLNESYKFIFDFELMYRFAGIANVRKIERTLAFYRIHGKGKTAEWSNFLVELYRFSRDWWPRWLDPQFRRTRGEFVTAFMRREWRFPQSTALNRFLYWTARKALAACVTLRLANPEAVARALRNRGTRTDHPVTVPAEIADATGPDQAPYQVLRAERPRYSALFCGFFLPQCPGISGGEIRDFHLVRHLLGFCRLTFLASHSDVDSERTDALSPSLEAMWRREEIAKTFPQYIRPNALARMESRSWRILDFLRRHDVPVFGPNLPRDVSIEAKVAEAYLTTFVDATLRNEPRDFLFVSPQVNPLGLLLDRKRISSRMVLLTYDLEAVRFPRLIAGQNGIRRAAGILEARRARAYERRNLDVYDGIVVVSELDRSILTNEMGIEGERVISVENGVDSAHFAFRSLRTDSPEAVLFVGSLRYRPNHLAAMRLIERIMPLVWDKAPEAQVWIVGQGPHPHLLRQRDGHRVFVTGKVPSVLPYLHRCRVMCAPIEIGSGTKYKILEALSAGAPVVCTPLALEGLDLTDEHVALGQTDAELAEAVLAAMRDPESAALRAKRGRAVIETTYAWGVVLAKLEPWLDRIAALPRRR
jgi:glycosyltransferase involved in cell wall biosynthesis